MHKLAEKALIFAGASGLTPVNLGIVAIVLAFFWWRPRVFRSIFSVVGSSGLLDRHPTAAIVIVASVPLLIRLLLLPAHPIPVPSIHDEFSYLLAADTFAHGRVTNPAHPLWHFFETYHVLPVPTYMSKYPPMQGLLLAAGQVLFGHPWWGVFLSIGVMAGSACWMLQGWLPVRWAALGALAIGFQFGIGHSWMNSYWGGAPAVIGASLTLGALARMRQFRPFPRHPVRDGVLFASGVAILLNSRPWEGMAIIAPAALAALLWVFTPQKGARLERIRTVLIPASVVLSVVAISMVYYNWRGTGSPLSMPYTVVHKTYSVAPLFVWQSRTAEPQYRHAVMKRFYLESEPRYQDANRFGTWRGWLALEPGRLRMAKDLLFGNFFLLLCLSMVVLYLSPSQRLLLTILGVFMLALALESWNQIHYFGPVIGVAAVLKMSSLRRLSTIQFRHRRIGIALAVAVIVCSSLNLVRDSLIFPARDSFAQDRAALAHELESKEGSHVVLVRYAQDHPPVQEWVYNRANIDTSKVIWAREMSDQENRQLFDYFKGRSFWLLQPDAAPPRLRPLSANAEQGSFGTVSLSNRPVPLEEKSIQWP